MAVLMKGRHLVSLNDFTTEEIEEVFMMTDRLKIDQLSGRPHRLLEGRALAMIFEKPSTRTRLSFEVGIMQLGGVGLFLSPRDLQIGRGETIADSARVISRYVDGIMARVFKHDTVEQLAKYSRVPVINGLSDLEHPCQVLTDYYTMKEKLGPVKGKTFAYVGDGANNMSNSLIWGAAKLGVNMVVCTPEGYDPDKKIWEGAQQEAKRHGCTLKVERTPAKGVKDADVIYTDVWTSMGQEAENEVRVKVFKPYQLNEALIKKAPAHAVVMHCLPAHRGEEITDEVVDGAQSVVFDQAENRLHVQKGVMALLMR
jgi:ornithine carbamoyltransferase